MLRRLLATLALFAALGTSPTVWAQALAPGSAQSGPLIGQVTVQFLDLESISQDIVFANMRARSGMPYSDALLDQDIRSLYATGLFESIEVRRALQDGRVDLVYEVRPKYRIGGISYSGNSELTDRRLTREVKSQVNGPLDERQIKADARAIFDLYQKTGFSQVAVDYSIERNRTSGRATVTFRVTEGPRVRIREVTFTGNATFDEDDLTDEMETRSWWIFSWLTGSGRFQTDVFDEDIDKLRDLYREEGFLDVQIDPGAVRFDYPDPGRLVITIPVVEGRQYRVGQITITGASLYQPDLLRRLLQVETGDVFAPKKLDEDVTSLRDFYGRGGYLETGVRLIRRPNLATGAIDLEYAINESGRFQVESVNIVGNTKTRSTVIVRELILAPGDTFDTVRMKISEQRLRNTRFFEEDLSLVPETTNIDDRRTLKVQLREGRTGNLSFGAGFSSLEQAVFFIELTQGNFDLFNWRSFFQGDGQKFRLRLQIGSESNEVVLSFEEPWLFERELAAGFTVYRQSSDYFSDLYQEIRTGFEVYLRKRLFELVEGRIAYSWQTVDITDVALGAPTPVRELEGSTSVSRVSLGLLRDTRDSLITTTRGNRYEFITEVAGGFLGGDDDYYRLEARGAQFFPTFRWQKQVLAIVGRTGVVQAYGRNVERVPVLDGDGQPTGQLTSRQVPYFERYFLGGPSTLRGFEFRAVGPTDSNGEPLGGKTFGFLSLEYSMDIVDPIRFALFYDSGFVNTNGYDWDPSNYNDNWGFGLRIFVLGAPLQLDYGIPITTGPFNDEGGQFNFSFGTRF